MHLLRHPDSDRLLDDGSAPVGGRSSGKNSMANAQLEQQQQQQQQYDLMLETSFQEPIVKPASSEYMYTCMYM